MKCGSKCHAHHLDLEEKLMGQREGDGGQWEKSQVSLESGVRHLGSFTRKLNMCLIANININYNCIKDPQIKRHFKKMFRITYSTYLGSQGKKIFLSQTQNPRS